MSTPVTTGETRAFEPSTARPEALAAEHLLAVASVRLAESLDVDATLATLGALAIELLADSCRVTLLDEAAAARGDYPFVHVALASRDPRHGELAGEIQRRFPAPPDSTVGFPHVIRTGRSQLVPAAAFASEALDAAATSPEHRALLARLDVRAALVVPLVAHGRTLGAITLVRHGPEPVRCFTERECYLAEELGRRAALAIDHARLYRDEQVARAAAEREARRVARLNALTSAVAAPLGRADVVRVILEQMVAAAGAIGGGVMELDPDGREFVLLDVTGYGDDVRRRFQRVPVDAPVPVRDALRTREAIYLMSADEFRAAGYVLSSRTPSGTTGAAWAALPLLLEDRVLGMLTLTFDDPARIEPAERGFLEAFARQCAQAIERARLFEAERVARDEAERASRAKSEFLAVMSHELRTPLNAIGGYAELLEMGVRGPVTAAQREDLQRIQRSQRHLLSLINEVLNYSRLESGTVTYDLRPLTFAAVVAAAVPLVDAQRAARRIELELDLPPGAPPVLADREKLQQILLNLLSNAVKFTPGGGRVSIAMEAERDARGQARMHVRDTGIGIPGDRLEAIFEPFVQVGRALNSPGEGTGLGLAISRDLARGMGGDLTVTSTPGEGSTFTLLLPGAGQA